MNNNFGFIKNDLEKIKEIFSLQPEIEEAFIFGSRAKGNYKNGSDVDIALKGSKLNFHIISKTSNLLNEETMMPYHFDILNYNTIDNKELIKHIDRAGIKIFTQKENATLVTK